LFLQKSAEAAASFFYALLPVIGAGRLRFWNLPNQQISEFGGKNMFDMKACGGRIKELREGIDGLTQEKLAEKLNTSDSHLRKIENGQRSASIDLYIDIAQYFNVSLDYLLLGEESGRAQIRTDIENAIDRLCRIAAKL